MIYVVCLLWIYLRNSNARWKNLTGGLAGLARALAETYRRVIDALEVHYRRALLRLI